MPPRRLPSGWDAFARKVRNIRAAGRCECDGFCGVDHTMREYAGVRDRRCPLRFGDTPPGGGRRARITLTVFHVCGCAEPCENEDHVRALCGPCAESLASPEDRAELEERQTTATAHAREREDERAAGQGDLFDG